MKRLLFLALFILSTNVVYSKVSLKKIKDIAKITPNTCQLNPHCKKNINPLWSKYLLDSDLAEEVVEEVLNSISEKNKENFFAKVVVADTGFDFYNQHDFLNRPFTIEKGHEKSGDFYIDPEGHGTAVTGIIAGLKVGLTNFTNLRIQRITEPFGFGRIERNLLEESVINACKDADLVNMSWGSKEFELGEENLTQREWYEFAQKQGCLVIKSSGNEGIKQSKFGSIPINGPLLTVGASNSKGYESAFSSTSMLMAPGEDIYTLYSHDRHFSSDTSFRACNYESIPIQSVDGTSFSAPATTATAAQVITILKARNVLPKYPLTKIEVIKKILLAASQYERQFGIEDHNLNAYIATLIAKNITPKDYNYGIDSYFNVIQKEKNKICNTAIPDCLNIEDCDLKRSCIKEIRKKAILCQENKIETHSELIKIFDQIKEDELMTYFTNKRINLAQALGLDDEYIFELKEKYLSDLWSKSYDSKDLLIDDDKAFEVFYLADKMKNPNYINAKNFIEVIDKSFFSYLIPFDPEYKRDGIVSSLNAKAQLAGKMFFKLNPKDKILVANHLENLYLNKNFNWKHYAFLVQFFIEESVITSVGQKLKNLTNRIILDSFDELFDDKILLLNNEQYRYIFWKIPSLNDHITSSFKKPYHKIKKPILKYILEFSNELFNISKEEIINDLILELHQLSKAIHKETDIQNYSIIQRTDHLNILNNLMEIVTKDLLESKIFNEKSVNLIKEISLIESPIKFSIGNIVPSYYYKIEEENYSFLLKDKEYFSKFLKLQLSMLRKTLELEMYFVPEEHVIIMDNIFSNFYNAHSFFNKYPDLIDTEITNEIWKLFDLALEKLQIQKIQRTYVAIPDKNTNMFKYFNWKVTEKIADHAIQSFTGLIPKIAKIDKLSHIEILYIKKLENVINLLKEDKINLEEKTHLLIREKLGLPELETTKSPL